MNRERAKELLPIIEAFANGKDIQFRQVEDDVNFENDWLELPRDEMVIQTFPAEDYEYRIKPSLREFTLEKPREKLALGDGCLIAYPLNDKHDYTHFDYLNSIKVREVIE